MNQDLPKKNSPSGGVANSGVASSGVASSGSYWATTAGLAAIVLWSTTVALARSLTEQLGPLTAAAGVHGVACIGAVCSLLRGRRSGAVAQLPRKYLLGCGALFVSYMICLYLGLGLAQSRQQALAVGLLNYLWPVLTLLLSVVVLRQKANWLLGPATLIALLGLMLVILPERFSDSGGQDWTSCWHAGVERPLPLLLGLLAAVMWALYSTLTRRWAGEEAHGGVDWFLIVTALVLVPLSALVVEPRTAGVGAISETLFLGCATYLAYGLWDTAMRKGNLVLVAAASYFTPLLSTIVSCIYLMVWPTPQLWWGCVLLVAGSLGSWRILTRQSRGDSLSDGPG